MDRYHIYEAIGKGKHSVVYKGRRKKTIQYYAIKSIDKSQRSRVLREVQVLRATNSAYVLKFHAWYETANHLWLVLEYCVGGDLLGLLKQDVRLPEASIKTFGKDLVTALRVAHEAGVLHCDLKPSNLLIDEDGRIKLCGFGLAKKVSEVVFFGGAGDDGTAATKSNGDGPGSAPAKKKSKLVGTPCYMAPELFGEHGVHSYASDLWAIGCVLYECAFGVPPFVSSSLSDLMEIILNDDPGGFDGVGAVDGKNLDGNERVGGTDAEPNVTKNFADLVQGLLNKDPSRRMNWETLLMHPFWVDGEKENANAKETENARWKSPPRKPLPAQNAFDAAVAASVRAELGDDAELFGVTQKRTDGNVSVDREHCENPIAPRSPTRKKSETEAAARREPRAKTFPKLVRASGSKSAEIVRLSLAARANLDREEGGASYADTGGRGCLMENGRDQAVSEILSPEKVTGAGDSVENNPSPRWKATSSCTAAGDVSLADADAELNFSEGVFCVAEEETDGGANVSEKEELEGARFLSGGGLDDGNSPVSRSKNVFEKSADLFSEQKLGERELTDIVSDPGADVAAAAAEGERQAAAAEEREAAAAAASREANDRQSHGDATTDGALLSAARGADRADAAAASPSSKPRKDAVEHELDHRISVLLDHPSDSQVKPIVLNRRIEINPPPVWDENALPFAALTATQMLAATQTDMELFLTKVYRSVAHSSPINEKVNTLSYFETLCCDTASANVLINSSLMTLFVRMLRASKAPALRVRLTSVMGLLLRHATYITPELASSGIVSVLTECLRDKNDKVRRRAAATLGELLFYIATQQHEAACAAANRGAKNKTSAPAKNTKDDDAATRAAVAAAAAADAWRIPASTVGTLLRTLRAGEDEIAQHYAVKTVENIVSHGGEWSAKVCPRVSQIPPPYFISQLVTVCPYISIYTTDTFLNAKVLRRRHDARGGCDRDVRAVRAAAGNRGEYAVASLPGVTRNHQAFDGEVWYRAPRDGAERPFAESAASDAERVSAGRRVFGKQGFEKRPGRRSRRGWRQRRCWCRSCHESIHAIQNRHHQLALPPARPGAAAGARFRGVARQIAVGVGGACSTRQAVVAPHVRGTRVGFRVRLSRLASDRDRSPGEGQGSVFAKRAEGASRRDTRVRACDPQGDASGSAAPASAAERERGGGRL